MRNVFITIFLRLDTSLNVLIISIELRNRMIRPVLLVIIINNHLESRFFLAGLLLVIETLLRQILLNLLHILVALGRRGEDASNIQRFVIGIFRHSFLLNLLEQIVVFDGIIDSFGCHNSIESA